MRNRNVYIIAGPNGSGKTTFANKFLPDYVKCPHFVNADLIAQGLSPFSPRSAAVDVKRRFNRGLYNFFTYYRPLADTWLLFNNADLMPRFIARERYRKTEVIDKELFQKIVR